MEFKYEKTKSSSEKIAVFADDESIGFLNVCEENPSALVWNPPKQPLGIRINLTDKETFKSVVDELRVYKDKMNLKYLAIPIDSCFDEELLYSVRFCHIRDYIPGYMYKE